MSPEEIPAVVGPYRVLQKLGEGWAGRVFLAAAREDKPFARRGDLLALKLYKDEALKDPREIERIEKRELKIGSTIAHPNVVSIHDYGRDRDGRPFLVMEYVDGQPLSSWVDMYHPISEPLLLKILSQILEGLTEIHRHDLIHRDLKPANIMLSEAFLAKVMDLGIVLPRAAVPDTLTPSDQFLASIRNSAPELLLNEHPDARADLYSFGTLMYFLLRGEEVFAQERHPARLAKLVEEADPEFDESIQEESLVRAHLQDLCRRLLAKKPGLRPRTEEIESIINKERKALGNEPRPLCGYIAAALTGLSRKDRAAITFAGHAMARVCKTLNIYPHQPRKATDPILHPGISPELVYWFDRRRIVSADLVIAICDEPSFGVGQELEIAASYGIPTLLVKSEGQVISRMLVGSPLNLIDDPVEYQSPEDLEKKLKRILGRHIEELGSRRIRVKKDYGAKLCERFRELRGAKNWTVDEAAYHYGISSRFVYIMENNPDFFHNAGLVVLTRVAGAYALRLSDLVSEVPVGELGGPIQDDANLTLIEEVAKTQHWAIEDFFEVRNQYRSGAIVAQRGKLTPEKIHEFHSALLKKRLSDQGGLLREK